MNESTLPVWLTILLFGAFSLFAIGYVNPYVSNANRLAVEDYRRGISSGPPLVIIRYHVSAKACLVFIILVTLASYVSFFVETFIVMLTDFGGGFIKGLFIVILASVLFFIAFMVLLIIHLMGETITTMSLKRVYSDRYGLRVEFDADL